MRLWPSAAVRGGRDLTACPPARSAGIADLAGGGHDLRSAGRSPGNH